MNNKKIIIFSSVDWSTHKQLHHQLTNSLIEKNNNVLFVENTGVRRIKINDVSRVLKKIKSWFHSTGGYHQSRKLLTILVTIIFPFPYSKFFNLINSYILTNKIKKWVSYEMQKPIIITFLPTPLIHKILDNLDYDLLVYYCANHMAKGSKESLPLRTWEDKMFSKSDYVISISEEITTRAKKFNQNIYKIPPGVDDIFFKKTSIKSIEKFKNIKKPIIGYTGAISNAIDFELLTYLIKKLEHHSFVFIGPIYEEKKFSKLLNYSNVYYFGELEHIYLPIHISYFDICIVPYEINDFTNSVYSCKLNEYLACGKIVISTSIKEHKLFSIQHKDIMFIADTKEDFKKYIIKNTYENIQANSEKKISVAKANSWTQRFKYFEKIMDENLGRKVITKKEIEFSFIDFYKKSRIYLYKFISTIILIYLLAFYSPIFYFAGSTLNDFNVLEKADAIVVYSGNDARFAEQSYLSRVVEAKKAFDKGFSKNIILISGKEQKIKEVEIMRSYLLDNGLSNDNIFIFENYPNNTFNGLNMIGKYIIEKNYSKIIYLTSDYHNKRSKLILDKNFPEIKIITPNLKKKNKKILYWTLDLKNIKIILYEILALIHNKINKRF